jgi:hypothetical protein
MRTIIEQYHRSRRELATAATRVRKREVLVRMKALMTKQLRKEIRADRKSQSL